MNGGVIRSMAQWSKAFGCRLMAVFIAGAAICNSPALRAAQESLHAVPSIAARPLLVDLDGNTWHWPEAGSGDKPLVLVFVATDCPIANGYLPLLQRMADDRAKDGVSFLLVHPRAGVTVEAARAHRAEFDIRIPAVLDGDQNITRAAHATVTPQAAVFIGSSVQPVYSGRIDDLYAGFGKKRAAATSHDLADALDLLLAGKPVAVSTTEPVGCLIESLSGNREEKGSDPQSLRRLRDSASDPGGSRIGPEWTGGEPGVVQPYDPLAQTGVAVESMDLTVADDQRDREIPLRVFMEEESHGPRPVVFFSHGLGGSREGSAFLGQHWASHGYVAVFLQHPGSDDSVWRDVPLRQRMQAMKTAASGRNLLLRVGDITAVLDQLSVWNGQSDHALAGRMDLSHVGMSGHSFGAHTTQAVAGQTFMGRQDALDPRIGAAIAMSPSPPALGDAERAFSAVSVPWLLMTGTDDTSVISTTTVKDRLKVFSALPAGDKYELVLDGAEHSAFTERPLPGDRRGRNSNHHRAILALSTAFWDAHLKGDPAAREWLDGTGPRSVLEPADDWQKK